MTLSDVEVFSCISFPAWFLEDRPADAILEPLNIPKVAQFVAAVLCFGMLVCLLDTFWDYFLWEGMVKTYRISLYLNSC